MRRDELIQRMLKASESIDKRQMKKIIKSNIELDDNSDIPNVSTNLIIAIEELSELQKELTKYMRGHRDELGLAEEMADVILMLVYISEICNVPFDQVYKALNVKLDRIGYRSTLIRIAQLDRENEAREKFQDSNETE